jgi:TonB family protein
MKSRLALILLFAALAPASGRGAAIKPAARGPQSPNVRVAVLDMGGTETGARASERVAKLLASAGAGVALLDRDMSRAAAGGVGYAGSLNMTLGEARALGAAVGCDFFFTGDAQTIRRSSSARPVYFESYASVFLVSARTGELVVWERPAAEADTGAAAESALLAALDSDFAARFTSALKGAAAREEHERFEPAASEPAPVIDLSSDETADAHKDLREPAPYRRLRPAYTDAASRAEAEATVDALVEIDADGRVGRVRVVRWAGFGLDEEVVATVRRMHFRPAALEGEPVAVRVLLRYNFRRPPKG